MCVAFCCLHAQDARRHGWYVPEGQSCGVSRQHPCRGAKAFPMIQTDLRTMETPQLLMAMLIVDSGSGMCKAGIARSARLAVCSLSVFAGPDARRHGQYGQAGVLRRDGVVDTPVVCNDRCRGGDSAENCGFTAVTALFLVVDIPAGTQRPIFMVHAVQQTIEIPQLLVDKVVDAPVMQVVVAVVAQRLLPMVQPVQQTMDSQLLFVPGGQCPCCAGRASSTGAGVWLTVVIPQLQLVENSCWRR